jgi:putative DNA primase/helicase
MNQHTNPQSVKGQDEVTKLPSQMPVKIQPDFKDGTNPLTNPETFKNGVQEIKDKAGKGSETPAHHAILEQLLEQVEPLDFEELANPNDSENFRLTDKHLCVLSVENIIEIAEKKRWGICKNNDFIYLFNGNYWAQIDKETFQKFLGEAAERQGVNKISAKFYMFRDKLFNQFLSTGFLPTPVINSETVLINLLNGTFEINAKGTELRPFDRSDFLTYQLPFKYDPEATAPLFEAYLNKVLPDMERQSVLAEFLGYVFLRNGSKRLKEEKILILYGTGANGKSVFFEIVNALLGKENVSSYSLQSLTNENGYYRAKIANKLVNYSSEMSGRNNPELFKLLASGEPVEARLPYGQPFSMENYAKLIFNCNELPKDVEHSNGFFRRPLIIPFDVTIPAHEQDKTLHSKIIASELSGVFNWVLNGLNRLLEQKGFSKCEAAEKAIEEYRRESDSVAMFLDECGYELSLTETIALETIFMDYKSYCEKNGFRCCNKNTFSNRLKNSGFEKKRTNIGMKVYAKKNNCF